MSDTPSRPQAAIADSKQVSTVGVKDHMEYVEAMADLSTDFLTALAAQAQASAEGEVYSFDLPKTVKAFVAHYRMAFNTAITWAIVNGFVEPTQAALAPEEERASRADTVAATRQVLSGEPQAKPTPAESSRRLLGTGAYL